MNNETDNRSEYCLLIILYTIYYVTTICDNLWPSHMTMWYNNVTISQTTFILPSLYLYVFTLILKVSKHSLYLGVKFYRITWSLY